MGLETATYISGLNASNPINATDVVGEGDDHLRLIKSTLLNTFPSITGAVSLTHTQINNAAIKTEANTFTAIQTIESAAPQLRFEETDQASTDQNWSLTVDGAIFGIRAWDATYASNVRAMEFTRSGNSISSARLYAAAGETALLASANGSVDLYHDNIKRFGSLASGSAAIYSDTSTDTEIRLLEWRHQDGTVRGQLGFIGSGDVILRNNVHSGATYIQGENSGGTVQTILYGSPDGSANLYYAGGSRLTTDSNGVKVLGSTSSGLGAAQNAELRLFQLDGTTEIARIGFLGTGNFYIRANNHANNVFIEAENSGGFNSTLFAGAPEGAVTLYYNAVGRFATAGEGANLYSAASTSTEPRLLLFSYQDTSIVGLVGHNSSSNFDMENRIHGGNVRLRAEDAGGTGRTMIDCYPDAGVWLYENATSNETCIITQGRTGDNTTNATVRHRNGNAYDIGLNIVPELASLDSGNVTLSVSNVGLMLTYNSGTARSLFLNSDSNIPAGSLWSLAVGPSAGTLTADAGTGVQIRYFDGSAWQTKAAAANATVGQGMYTIWKEQDNLFWISGPAVS